VVIAAEAKDSEDDSALHQQEDEEAKPDDVVGVEYLVGGRGCRVLKAERIGD
jgi:hypothetical protein